MPYFPIQHLELDPFNGDNGFEHTSMHSFQYPSAQFDEQPKAGRKRSSTTSSSMSSCSTKSTTSLRKLFRTSVSSFASSSSSFPIIDSISAADPATTPAIIAEEEDSEQNTIYSPKSFVKSQLKSVANPTNRTEDYDDYFCPIKGYDWVARLTERDRPPSLAGMVKTPIERPTMPWQLPSGLTTPSEHSTYWYGANDVDDSDSSSLLDEMEAEEKVWQRNGMNLYGDDDLDTMSNQFLSVGSFEEGA